MCNVLMQVNGKYILWDHLTKLFKLSQAESGLYLGGKMNYEHLNLTPFSRMNVRLGAQVCCLPLQYTIVIYTVGVK